MSAASALAGAPEGTTAGCRDGLARDDRGVIMVVGVMFTFFWIGLSWFLYGIGSAIAYRENLQNAADAGAFAAAVYDARGMNILAMINVVMGVALAMLVAVKILQLVLFAAQAAQCAAGEAACAGPQFAACIPGAVAECEQECGIVDTARTTLKTVDSGIHNVLKASHYLEVGVAVGWPWVSAGKTAAAGKYYSGELYDPAGTAVVPLVVSFSYSQIPYGGDNDNLTNDIGNFSGSADSDTGDTQTRYGLPVASEQYSNLCKVAIMDAGSLGGLAHGPIPGAISGVLQSAHGWLCDAGNDTPSKILDTPVIGIGYIGFPIFPGLPNSCALDKGQQTELPASGPAIADSTVTYSPMKIYGKATMGLDYFGVWSTAIGNFNDAAKSKVQIAGQQSSSSPAVADPPKDAVLGLARAEFYYDPRPDEVPRGAAAQTDEITIDTGDSVPIHNVLWNMRWRARLRRYHYFPGILDPGDQSIGAVEGLMRENIATVMWSVASAALNGQDIVDPMIGPTTDVSKQNNPPATGFYH